MFKLVYRSLWTTYPVDTFPSLDDCEGYCATHYDAPGLTFKRDTDGILKAVIEADGDIVVLNVYETESAHAS
jgi:hypothetical protein